jgi:hypothetical protein
LQFQLIRTNLATGDSQTSIVDTPVALGREIALMPGMYEGDRVTRIVLADDQVADYHALIVEQEGELRVTDQSQGRGLRVNGVVMSESSLQEGDRVQIGAYDLQIQLQLAAAGVNSEPSSASQFNDQGECDRMVGFLFKRRCGRTSQVGCPYCHDGQVNEDPYFYERSYYSGYGTYDRGYWGSTYYYSSGTRNVDFTDADSASFEREMDTDYERDMGAS